MYTVLMLICIIALIFGAITGIVYNNVLNPILGIILTMFIYYGVLDHDSPFESTQSSSAIVTKINTVAITDIEISNSQYFQLAAELPMLRSDPSYSIALHSAASDHRISLAEWNSLLSLRESALTSLSKEHMQIRKELATNFTASEPKVQFFKELAVP